MLLPLDEVPVHVPLRRPRPLRFERLRVPVWNPYSRGRLSPAKSEDRKGGEGKTDANLTIFFSTCCASHPNSSPRPGEALHFAPSARKSATLTSQKTALCAPASTQEVSESENRPATRGTAHSEVQVDDRGIDRPIAALHFLLPTGDSRSGRRSFDSKHLPSPARR